MARPRGARVDASVALRKVDTAQRELWHGIAEDLRRAILDGSIAAGVSLVEADLAARFGVSRGPVRDALRDLARQGLVIDLPRRGTVVSTLSLRDIAEVYEVREGLEIIAIRLAADRATEAHLLELERRIEELEAAWEREAGYSDSLALDLDIHRTIVDIPGNGRLTQSHEQMLVQTRLHAVTASETNPLLRSGMDPGIHRGLSEALRERDAEASAAAVVAHYAHARERLLAGHSAEAGE